MKKTIGMLLAVFLVAFAGGSLGTRKTVQAQTPTALQLTGTLPHTSCTLSGTGSAVYCFATDGEWESINGAAFVQVQTGTAAAAGVQKVNGVAPGSTGNVTISCPGTTPTTPVSVTPAVSATGATATVTATGSLPSMVVTTNCTATGS